MYKSTAYIQDAQKSDDLRIAYYGLALSIANQFSLGTSFDDDIRGTAILALCQAYDRYKKGQVKDINIRGYFGEMVKYAIIDAIRKRHIVTVPNSTMRLRAEQGKDRAVTIVTDFDTGDEPNCITLPEIAIDTTEDYIHELQLTEEEMVILGYRLDGKTIREIADHVKLSKSMVSLIIEGIKKKWKKWLRD